MRRLPDLIQMFQKIFYKGFNYYIEGLMLKRIWDNSKKQFIVPYSDQDSKQDDPNNQD